MILIHKSETADTRTCDFANTSRETLLASSIQHIGDVHRALGFFGGLLVEAAGRHDFDKLSDIDGFHRDFVTGFKQTGWWDAHRGLNRHHLLQADGVREDVNLIDVLDFIADCVMAGMARNGSVYDLKLSPELLEKAFQNTVTMLKAQVVVADSAPNPDDESTRMRRMGGNVDYQALMGGIYHSPANSSSGFANRLAQLGGYQDRSQPVYSGQKPLVICGGVITEAKDLDDAQRVAEEQAHAKSANAHILYAVKMVAPKRDVVTTDLP